MIGMTGAIGEAWWRRPWLLAALVLATGVPILMVTLPPLTDYLGHMGRYRVQLDLAHSEHLQRNWDFDWALIANLGVDLLMEPLSRVLGLERAIWAVALVLPPFLAWGLLRTSAAIHGRIPATAIAMLPFALAYPYQYGFVNFWLGLGIAFHLFAFWVRIDEKKPWQMAVFAIASIVLWVCHIYAWGVMCVLVGTHELARGWASGERNPALLIWRGVRRSWFLMLPLLLMAAWRSEGAGAATLGWFRWRYKLYSFRDTLRDQNFWLDVFSLGGAVLLLYIGLRDRRGRFEPGMAMAAFAFFAMALLMPFQLFGSAYADARVWPVAFMTGLLAIRIEPETGKLAKTIAGVAMALLLIRIGFAVDGYARYERDHSRHLKALDFVEPGTRVAILARYPCPRLWRRLRLEHLGSIAILRREAFVNSQWDVPGAQLIKPLAAIGTRFNADPSQFVEGVVCPRDIRQLFGRKLAQLPRDRFDYVWILDQPTDPPLVFPGLTPLYKDERTILFRIEKDQPQ